MSQYAKLVDGQIQYAPKQIPRQLEVDGELVDFITTNPTDEMLEEAGYLPVAYTNPPGDAPEGFYYEPGWEEQDGSIVQTWELVEDPYADDISAEEAMEILTGGVADEED